MGKQLSSVVGPAKWAAAGSLVTALGLGAVYALTREPAPQTAALPAPPVVVAQREPVLISQIPDKAAAVPDASGSGTAGEPRVAPVPAPRKVTENAAEPQVQPAEPEEVVPSEPAPEVKPEPKVEPKPAPATPPVKPTPRFINVNTASAAELELLPSVGPTLAKAIIAYRTKHGAFRSFEDLDKVPGIGPKTLEKFKDRVTFR